MKVYTKRGDGGNTNLIGGSTVHKSDLRIESYGTLDELNSYIGVLSAQLENENVLNELHHIQHHLFDVGSVLADPYHKLPNDFELEHKTALLESWIDAYSPTLPELKYFIIPGGTLPASSAHVCRTITRRAERIMVELYHTDKHPFDITLIQYINRLSDYFFVLARHFNHVAGESDKVYTSTGEVFH